ncbi:hypothetical protein GALMADRAFT_77954 [Galerina marginata CBS 339.88]|uniref:Oxidase ustYa n=1 Tax=Galerina marginata (strain CBS 339.88) TaxID=685588 RepID=A0A067SFS1_GALM3|nr:hypothetical protein GALMADRAFT_77954 [Galerina marginata CBS 339.88]
MVGELLDDEVFSMTADSDWDSNFPRGRGWVKLGPNSDFYVLSMYHQLHCLDAMRYAYVAAKTGNIAFPGNGTGFDHHMNHCLTYLREAVLCAADTTLERSETYITPQGVTDRGATGMGMVHQCRNWVQVREYLESQWDDSDDIYLPKPFS